MKTSSTGFVTLCLSKANRLKRILVDQTVQLKADLKREEDNLKFFENLFENLSLTKKKFKKRVHSIDSKLGMSMMSSRASAKLHEENEHFGSRLSLRPTEVLSKKHNGYSNIFSSANRLHSRSRRSVHPESVLETLSKKPIYDVIGETAFERAASFKGQSKDQEEKEEKETAIELSKYRKLSKPRTAIDPRRTFRSCLRGSVQMMSSPLDGDSLSFRAARDQDRHSLLKVNKTFQPKGSLTDRSSVKRDSLYGDFSSRRLTNTLRSLVASGLKKNPKLSARDISSKAQTPGPKPTESKVRSSIKTPAGFEGKAGLLKGLVSPFSKTSGKLFVKKNQYKPKK